jgi:hypothetical protein
MNALWISGVKQRRVRSVFEWVASFRCKKKWIHEN